MIYITKPEQVKSAAAQLSGMTHIGVDTETTGLDPHTNKVLLLQLGNKHMQFVIDVYKVEGHLQPVLNLLTDKEIVKVAHNAKFDYKFIRSSFGIRVANMGCTLILEQLLTKGFKVSGFKLADLVEKYNLGYMNKEEQSSFIDMKYGDAFTESQLEYAGKDIEVLIPIYSEQIKLLMKRDMLSLGKLESECIEAISDMEYNGMYLDQEGWLKLESKATKNAADAKKELDPHFEPYCAKDMFGELEINYASPMQIKPVLSKIVGRPLESTNERYLNAFPHDAIKALLKYRGALKQISTYGKDFLTNINPKTKRIHANYLQLGTDSGRMSCRNPNMQNIPHDQEYRTPFATQAKDYKIISADFAAQELRVLTQLSKEQSFLTAISEGKDLHCMSASLLFNIPYEDFFEDGKVKSDMKDYRTKSKTLTFGLVYGMGAWGLAQTLKIDKNEAQELLNRYFTVFPSIRTFLNRMSDEAQRNRYAYSPLDGRRRDLSNMDWDHWKKRKHALNIAKNHPIQGASASVTKLALIKIHKYIRTKSKDAGIVAVIHDEILVECHKDIVKEMKKVVENSMIEAFNFYCPDVPMEVDAIIDNHWIH